MNNILKYSALSLLLSGMSCSGLEESTGMTDSEKVEVTFSVSAEETFRTRATGREAVSQGTIGLGTHIDRLVCAVYDVNGNLLSQLGDDDNGQKTVSLNNENKFDVSFTLVRGQEYKIAFWAQDSSCEAYDTSDLKNVQISYEDAYCNDDTRDVFCGVEVFTVSSLEAGVRSVTLRRPFAQINVVMKQDEFNTLFASDTQVTSKITLGPVAKIIDVVNNNVDESQLTDEVSFSASPIPNAEQEGLMIYNHNNDQFVPCKYLAMCYILVGDENTGTSTYSSTLSKLEVNLSSNTLSEKTLSVIKDDEVIPIQRNWATNVLISEIED